MIRKNSVFAMVVVLALLLGACSPPSAANKSNATAATAEQKQESQPKESQAKESEPKKGGKTQIHWLQHWVTEQGPDKINEVKKDFEAKNPDVELIFDNIPFVQQHDKVLALNMAGMPPDIVTTTGAWIAEFADAGIIDPIDNYVNKLPQEYKDALQGPMFLPWKGKLYGMPVTNGNTALFYNPTFTVRKMQKAHSC